VRNGKVWGKEESWDWVEQKMEAMSYFLTKTSIGLAKEKGSCPRRTKYHDGIFPMDTAVGGVSPNYDWEILKEDAKKYGIRNATLMALMPSETSSQLANETNGIEPPRHLITNKGNKDATTAQVVPEYSKYNHAYEIAWNIPVSDYLQVIGRLQKYVDQAASSNTSYNPNTQEVTVKTLLSDLLLSYKLGLKTLYYSNTNTDSIVEDDCESGACKI
jgi:ribonucleoside-diphosphate reductase alpha chain